MKKICIDPGHGGKDNGAVWGFNHEDDISLAVSFYLDYELKLSPHKYKTLLTRNKDEFVSLEQRCEIANDWKAHLFLSIHCDSFHDFTVKGMTVHIFKDTTISGIVGRTIIDQLAIDFPEHRNRGVMESNFYVLKYTTMRAALIESDFLSNPEMREWLHESENQKNIAISLKKGIDNFFYPSSYHT